MDPIKTHVKELLANEIRLDGRKLDEFRNVCVELGCCKNADGSARAKIGDTEVIAGVKLSVEEPFPDSPDQGALVVNAEFYPMANKKFESGPPSVESIELARVVDRAIRESHAVDPKKLCIKEGEKVWMISIDICPINISGNFIDAASLAALAALKDAKFPEFDGEKVDYSKMTKNKLPITKEPLSITVVKINGKFLVDLTEDEEGAIESRLTVGVLEDGNICSLQKGEEGPLTAEDIERMIDLAVIKGKELRVHLR